MRMKAFKETHRDEEKTRKSLMKRVLTRIWASLQSGVLATGEGGASAQPVAPHPPFACRQLIENHHAPAIAARAFEMPSEPRQIANPVVGPENRFEIDIDRGDAGATADLG